jgi:hypothetical protein
MEEKEKQQRSNLLEGNRKAFYVIFLLCRDLQYSIMYCNNYLHFIGENKKEKSS